MNLRSLLPFALEGVFTNDFGCPYFILKGAHSPSNDENELELPVHSVNIIMNYLLPPGLVSIGGSLK